MSFPNIAYIVAGFVLVVGIILLFMFLRRRRNANGRNPDADGLQMSFENAIYSMEDTGNDHRRSAVNMLYMTSEECRNNVTSKC